MFVDDPVDKLKNMLDIVLLRSEKTEVHNIGYPCLYEYFDPLYGCQFPSKCRTSKFQMSDRVYQAWEMYVSNKPRLQ